ncbi:MAG: pilus assembly protein PilM, partial [Eubacteriales bacterium]
MKKKWLALIRGNKWTVAKVAVGKKQKGKTNIKVFSIKEYEIEKKLNDDSENKDVSSKETTIDKDKKSNQKVNNLKIWLKKQKVPLKNMSVAVSCLGVITRIITLPEMPSKDLDKLLTTQIEQYFTLNTNDYLIDYRIVKRFKDNGQAKMDLLLAALPIEKWTEIWEMWSELGVNLKIVDIVPDCLARLYSRLSPSDSIFTKLKNGPNTADMVIIDLNQDRVEFVILDNGVFFLYSDMEVMLAELEEQIITKKLKDSDTVYDKVSLFKEEKMDNKQNTGQNTEQNLHSEGVGNLEQIQISKNEEAVAYENSQKTEQNIWNLEDLDFNKESNSEQIEEKTGLDINSKDIGDEEILGYIERLNKNLAIFSEKKEIYSDTADKSVNSIDVDKFQGEVNRSEAIPKIESEQEFVLADLFVPKEEIKEPL